jgi:transcription initiation factor TFIIH subunit 2
MINFTENFFKSNILSFLSIFVINDSNCISVIKTSNNPQEIKNSLLSFKIKPLGPCTLFTSLNSIIHSMSQNSFTPFFEIAVILSSSYIVDFSENVYESILNSNISINCFSLVGEIEIIKQLCFTKGGFFKVANSHDSISLKLPYIYELLHSSLKIRSNFANQTPVKTLCSCHSNFNRETYICNRCFNSICTVPSFCPICSCFAVTNSQIQMYNEIQNRSFTFSLNINKHRCELCNIENGKNYSCDNCSSLICTDCITFITNTVKSCPKCSYQD